MTRYLPKRPVVWHNVVPGLCVCHTSYAGRGMIDPTCDWHTAIDVIEDLRDAGWTVEPPTEPWPKSEERFMPSDGRYAQGYRTH